MLTILMNKTMIPTNIAVQFVSDILIIYWLVVVAAITFADFVLVRWLRKPKIHLLM